MTVSHRPSFSVVSLGAASLGVLAASLTLHAAGCGVSDTDLYNKKGECPSSFNDGNPCTLDACPSGGATHVFLFDGAPCALGENSGTCKQGLCDLPCLGTPLSCKCGDPRKDCPAETACLGWTCEDAHCNAIPRTDPALPATELTSGDCKKIVCSAAGNVESAPDDGDKPDDDGPCTIGVCVDGTPMSIPRDVGAACGGQTGVCDSMSKCVACVEGTSAGCASGQQCYKADDGKLVCAPTTCFDNTQDSGETDKDCGGPCKPCALGSICTQNADCSNHICAPGFAPGEKVCCKVQCGGACNSCGKGSGTCESVPTGTPDPVCNQQLKVCAQGVGCAFPAWHACAVATDCISSICDTTKMQCFPGGKSAPCLTTLDCLSNACDGNNQCAAGGKNAPCFTGDDCVSTVCDPATLTCQ